MIFEQKVQEEQKQTQISNEVEYYWCYEVFPGDKNYKLKKTKNKLDIVEYDKEHSKQIETFY